MSVFTTIPMELIRNPLILDLITFTGWEFHVPNFMCHFLEERSDLIWESTWMTVYLKNFFLSVVAKGSVGKYQLTNSYIQLQDSIRTFGND